MPARFLGRLCFFQPMGGQFRKGVRHKLIYLAMYYKKIFLMMALLVGLNACAVLNSGNRNRTVPDMRIDLKVNSLHAKQVQEQGVIGAGEGDEVTLVYTLNAYDAKGSLLSVNNGFWGTRTINQNALILADEFDRISVHVPRDGKVIAAFALLEIDDYKGERKIAKVKNYTRSERYPKYLAVSNFDEDQTRTPLELVAKSLKIAGYKYFESRHMNLSINDDLGSTKKVLDAAELARITSGSDTGRETYEMDGTQINEKYLYVLKYDLNAVRSSGSEVNANTNR